MSEPRRRRVELVAESSDVRRMRGLGVAALVGALALVAALVALDGPKQTLGPGPLARPHRALACASCHADRDPNAACTSCHAGQRSQRASHERLTARDALACSTCHGIHRSEQGIAFEADGRAFLFGPGFETKLESSTNLPATTATLVPLVPDASCASCHDRKDARDAAAHCFTPGGRFSLCFDEHRRVGAASSTRPAARDAAVEATRVLAVAQRVRTASLVGTAGTSAFVVLFGLAVVLLALKFARRRAGPPRPLPSAQHASVRRLPVIDAARCLGCAACVDACPFDALEVRRYVAVVARPDDCCGAGPCEQACPNGSLILRSDESPRPGPLLSERLEVPERPGLFLAGDVTGGALIRNAILQGASVAEGVAARSKPARAPLLDLAVIGAGPAGLSAALRARELGLSVVVLEQASVAESIRRFSRGKLVLDTPSTDGVRLPLWISDASKEQLLQRWQHSVRSARLDVREGARVTNLRAEETAMGARVYVVEVERGAEALEEHRARHVLIAIGSRGTPRKLPVPVPERLERHVHYELSDARAFAGQRLIVLGLGDVAMESALALAAQPGSTVTVVHRGAGFQRGKRRNIDALSALVARGRVKIFFHAEVNAVEPAGLVVSARGVTERLPFDALFVHIGTVPSNELLRRSGVCFRE